MATVKEVIALAAKADVQVEMMFPASGYPVSLNGLVPEYARAAFKNLTRP